MKAINFTLLIFTLLQFILPAFSYRNQLQSEKPMLLREVDSCMRVCMVLLAIQHFFALLARKAETFMRYFLLALGISTTFVAATYKLASYSAQVNYWIMAWMLMGLLGIVFEEWYCILSGVGNVSVMKAISSITNKDIGYWQPFILYSCTLAIGYQMHINNKTKYRMTMTRSIGESHSYLIYLLYRALFIISLLLSNSGIWIWPAAFIAIVATLGSVFLMKNRWYGWNLLIELSSSVSVMLCYLSNGKPL